jgi:hypothetical protein
MIRQSVAEKTVEERPEPKFEKIERPQERGRIYNTITPNPISHSQVPRDMRDMKPELKPTEDKKDDDDDDWGAIPAFLRRSKIK